MRLIAPGGGNPPREVNKYLLLHEQQVITVRMHPAVLFGPIAIALGGLIIAVVLQGSIFRHENSIMVVVWLAWGVLLARTVWLAATWAVDYFVVTSQRMILTSGLLVRKVAMMPLNKVTDMSFQRSFPGRLFGYGEFIIESAGQDQALRNIPYIPYPEQLYLEVCNLLFPGDRGPGGGGGDNSANQCRYPGPPLENLDPNRPLNDPGDD
jgi:membrane protein YdbS with pleckstrin-like domain